MNFRSSSELTSFKLSDTFCLFFNTRSSVVFILFRCSCVLWLVLQSVSWYFRIRFFWFFIFTFAFSFWASLSSCFCASSLSWLSSSWFWISSVGFFLFEFSYDLLYFCISNSIKEWISQCFYCGDTFFWIQVKHSCHQCNCFLWHFSYISIF